MTSADRRAAAEWITTKANSRWADQALKLADALENMPCETIIEGNGNEHCIKCDAIKSFEGWLKGEK